MSDDDLIRRGDALALPPYDCDGDPAGRFDNHVFVRREDIRKLPPATPSLDAAAMQRMAADLIRKMLDDAGDHPTASAMRRVVADWGDAILALPAPTPADRLGEARKLPEVAALVEAGRIVRDSGERQMLFMHNKGQRVDAVQFPVVPIDAKAWADLCAAVRALTGEARHD